MSEFTKLGGYLIQGQPEVVHDSALSGNGLEGSPLGLSEEFITGTMRPATQSALNLNIGHPENNNVAEAGATIGSNNAAASTGLAVGFGASAFGMSIAVGEDTHASNRGIAVGRGLDANGIAAFGTYNFEINTGHECIFVVGNGTDSANRSDAFEIYKDGTVEAPNFVTTNNVHLSALTGVSEANDLVHSNSGTWNEASAKLDTSAFSDVSGTFLTAHQDLSDYQTTAGMTAYQSAGDYLSANALDNVSGDWNRISALSGYSAMGWSVSPTAGKDVFAKKVLFSPQAGQTLTAYLGVYSPGANTAGDVYTYITDGSIYLYNRNRSNSAQFIRPDTIVKWNNYATNKLNVSDFKLSALNDASANNIVLTASLPATPDANTLYLIPEV